MTPQHHLPADIERTSLSIITAELDAMGLTPPPETAAVVKRVIHTTADFDYARNLRFTPGAVAAGVAALQAAAPIVTDTNMALSGITKPGLARLGGTALCYMADPEVAALAKANGTTRAVASMQRAAAEHPGAILAVGNAPTALLTIADLPQGLTHLQLLDTVEVDLLHTNGAALAVLDVGGWHAAVSAGKLILAEPVAVDLYCAGGSCPEAIQAKAILCNQQTPKWLSKAGDTPVYYDAESPTAVVRPGKSVVYEEVQPLAVQ